MYVVAVCFGDERRIDNQGVIVVYSTVPNSSIIFFTSKELGFILCSAFVRFTFGRVERGETLRHFLEHWIIAQCICGDGG